MDSVLKQPVKDLTSSRSISKENQIAIHDHNFENKVKGDPAENNNLPLSFYSFEWLRKRSKVTNKTQKFEIMDEDITFLEMDNEKDE